MDAKKCDRCGKFYDHYYGLGLDQSMKKRFKIDSTNSMQLVFTPKFSTQSKNYSEVLDLCPDCMHGLLKWMGGDKDAE